MQNNMAQSSEYFSAEITIFACVYFFHFTYYVGGVCLPLHILCS